MRVAIFGSRFNSEKLNQVINVFQALHKYDAEIYICQSFYSYLTTFVKKPPHINGIIYNNNFTADYALSIGGDGTYLRTAHRIGDKEIPILGINIGRLGFLADVDSVDVEDVISELYKNYYRISEMTQLKLKVNGQIFSDYPSALNEVAVLKRDSSSMINIHVSVNGEYLNGYQADGLVIATPTGSTAYALSAGGPIIMPGSQNLLIAAVAPHNLTIRPLVLSDTSIIDLEVESRSQNFLVSLDGNSFTMSCAAKLQVSLADYTVKAIKRRNHTYTETLRKKLMWGIDPRGDVR